MYTSILNAISGLITIVIKILTGIQEGKLRKAGRNEVVIEQLQADKKAGQRSNEIDSDVLTADLNTLRDSMSKYRRD